MAQTSRIRTIMAIRAMVMRMIITITIIITIRITIMSATTIMIMRIPSRRPRLPRWRPCTQ